MQQQVTEPQAGRRDITVHDGYRPIEDYGVLGDGHTAALVARDGSIDWACFPRFDAPSIFARILDAEKGGFCQLRPVDEYTVEREYLAGTAILATRFTTASGSVELLDFMPPGDIGCGGFGERAIIRRLRGISGQVEVALTFAPRFDYARALPTWELQPERGARARHDNAALTLYCPIALHLTDDQATGQYTVAAEEEVVCVLGYERQATDGWADDVANVAGQLLDQTKSYWHTWIEQCTYVGPYVDTVRRSAVTLKLLDYTPSGAIIAAPTASLPEEIGGERNWDYRYSWPRDTAFTLHALFGIGYRQEAAAFLDWVVETNAHDPRALQVIYGIEGERDLPEFDLDHLSGYRDSRPVHIGNGAHDQRQLDIYGEIVDCAFLHHRNGGEITPKLWDFICGIVDYVCEIWGEPDQGLWEVRGGPRHFVYSKALCWVALDRGIRLAERTGNPDNIDRWVPIRDTIHAELLREGYNEEIGAFTQAYGSTDLDAAVLALQLRKVLPANDPRIISTVERVTETLGVGDFLHRYTSDDGLRGEEGAFLLCSFWLVSCLAESGRWHDASALFDRLLTYGNDVGLYAEEIDPATGHHLGNFPQGFTHIGLINAALTLHKLAPGNEEESAELSR